MSHLYYSLRITGQVACTKRETSTWRHFDSGYYLFRNYYIIIISLLLLLFVQNQRGLVSGENLLIGLVSIWC